MSPSCARGRALRRSWSALLVLLAVADPPVALAADARSILDRVQSLEESERRWSDRTQVLRFEIHGRDGDLTRELRVYERRASPRERRALIRLLDPPKLRGLGLLAFSTAGGGGRQWLYQPGAARSRELSSGARKVAFVDSDLTYDDLDMLAVLPSLTSDEVQSTLRGTDRVDGTPCSVIELSPTASQLPYRRIVLWLGEADLFARRLDLFGDGSDVVKRITQSDVTSIGKIPVARRMRIETIADDTSTAVTATDTRFDIGLSEDCVSQLALTEPTREEVLCRPSSPARVSAPTVGE